MKHFKISKQQRYKKIIIKYIWMQIYKICINKIVIKGKKTLAIKIFNEFIQNINKLKFSWKIIICKCFLLIKPIVILKKFVKKFNDLLYPSLTSYEHELKLAAKWLIWGTKNRKNIKGPFSKKLTIEIFDILNNKISNSKTFSLKKQYNEEIINCLPSFKVVSQLMRKRQKKW